jgi:hypothetical protein
LLFGLAPGCRPPVLVPAPSTHLTRIDSFTAIATSRTSGVSVAAQTHAWESHPRAGRRAVTPVLVRVHNGGAVPLRISRDSFVLVTSQTTTYAREFRALAPDQIDPLDVELSALELKPATLASGGAITGFVYFQPIVGTWGIINLRTTLDDARNEKLLETVDIPLQQDHLRTCSLDGVALANDEPHGVIFDTCLP